LPKSDDVCTIVGTGVRNSIAGQAPARQQSADFRERYLLPGAALIARLLVGGIFLVAAIPKLGDTGGFVDSIRAYHLMPPTLVVPFAIALPWVELLAGGYLLLGYMSHWAGVATALLLAIFVVALTDALITGNTAHSCGCFGKGAESNPVLAFLAGGNTITPWDDIRDAILIGLSLAIAAWGAGAWSVDRLLARKRL
jgi:uncharacterized membrane protein YphA (DoxX/SURF4 family)